MCRGVNRTCNLQPARSRVRSIAVGLFAICTAIGAPIARAQSSAIPPQPGVQVGQQPVTGSSWTFTNNLLNESGPWTSVTITNTNCTVPYRPGTAQAGAVIFTALLSPAIHGTAMLQAYTGSSATGDVTLLPMADTGGTNVTASLDGLEPFVVGTTLTVCLTLGVPPPLLADIDVNEQQVAATNFDVTGVSVAPTDTHQNLIAISGTQTTPDGTYRQLVFFFLNDAYLGTDTSIPSLAPLQLVGSPGAAQIDVQYSDPAGGQPVTITYTWSSGALTASDTPPGH
jgi:hypothetical protein